MGYILRQITVVEGDGNGIQSIPLQGLQTPILAHYWLSGALLALLFLAISAGNPLNLPPTHKCQQGLGLPVPWAALKNQ